VLAGLPLAGVAPGLEDGLLVAVTERRSRAEIDHFADAMGEVLSQLGERGEGPDGEGQVTR
jgi:glycine cleavage system protein P-like pyridoxal-binding family